MGIHHDRKVHWNASIRPGSVSTSLNILCCNVEDMAMPQVKAAHLMDA